MEAKNHYQHAMETFTAVVESLDSNSRCLADFVVINGEGRTLLCKETAEKLHYSIGHIHVNSVGDTAVDIRAKYMYQGLFDGVGLVRGYKLKLHID